MANQVKSVGFSDYDTEQAEIERRRAYAQALQQQGQTPMGPTEMAGGWAVRKSPLEGLAKMLQAYGGRKGQEAATDEAKALQARRQADRGADMQALAAMLRGTPGGLQADAADNVTQMPARPGGIDPAQLGQLRSPEMQNFAMQQYLQQMPKNPEPFTLTPGAVRYDAQGRQVAAAPQNAPQQAPSNLDRLIRERAALPPGDARIATYDNAIRKESETAKQISPTIVMPKQDKTPIGYRTKPDGSLEAIPGGPADPKVVGAKKGAMPLSATAQKELFEADDVVNSSQNAIQILKSIVTPDPKTGKSQNDLAYEGGTANVRRIGMSFVPVNSEGENATVDLQNKVTGQALEQLKAVFGGMPTEGERKILLELQGSVNQKASQRKEIFDRAIKLAERRMTLAQDKAKRLREGTYFGAGVATNQDGGQWQDIK